MEQHDDSLAAPLEGRERRSIGEPRPGLGGKAGVGFGQNLSDNSDIGGNGEAVERAVLVELGEPLRAVPRHRAAEHAAVAPQPHGGQIVGVVGEPRPGETQQHPALFDKGRQRVEGFARRDLFVSENKDIRAIGEGGEHRIGVAGIGFQQQREGRQRLVEIMDRRQQRLRRVGGLAADDGDAPHAAARVDQRHRAGGVLPDDA